MAFRRVFLPEKNRFIKIFFKGKAGVAGVLYPAGRLGRADNAHFIHTHGIQHFCRFKHGITVAAIHICLHLDTKAVFDAERNCIQRRFLGAFVISHPIVITYAVKGYFHKRHTADSLHAVKRLLVYEISVCVQLLDKHSARVDTL